jgi:hypothetical protein
MPWGFFYGGGLDETPEPPRKRGVNQGLHRGVTKSPKPKPRRGRR